MKLTIRQLNSFQKEVKVLHEKYGVGMAELRITLKKGTYSISEPIELINETVLIGI